MDSRFAALGEQLPKREMASFRLFVGGRGVVCAALPLPDAHLAFWRSLSDEQLCEMGRSLIVSGNGDVPEGIAADPAVWGDASWLHIAGIDLADETTVSVWIDDKEADETTAPGALEKLTTVFKRLPLGVPFQPVTGKSYLLYWEYEKAGYFHDLGSLKQFEASLVSLEITRFPDARSLGLCSQHRIINRISYRGLDRSAEVDYWYDYGSHACVSRF